MPIENEFNTHFAWKNSFILLFSISLLLLPNKASANPGDSISNDPSYRNFIFRQYFIDALNISHASLVRSLIHDERLSNRKIYSNHRRKRSNNEHLSSSPVSNLNSISCETINNQVRSNFIWSFRSKQSFDSVELIYHIDEISLQTPSMPLEIHIKTTKTNEEIFKFDTFLQFDVNRDFYFVDIVDVLQKLPTDNSNLTIESRLDGKSCQTIETSLILSSISNQNEKTDLLISSDLHQVAKTTNIQSSTSVCQIRKIRVHFEELGLAYLIIRPKEYFFTYCDGLCSPLTHYRQQSISSSALHALFRLVVKEKHPNIPQSTCVPTKFADDHFLIRRTDGSLELFPIRDIVVKQCACL